ncbi:phytanoyl-CoA dioxygenase family protein [Collimonas sp. OK412]|jgi:ectoine hydroxylase-related dioxygenase (phytanoyl-CoA dioxygenase family)|uniref:phytanoyl-CoA dioxygenase family protein n=1 Tax=Collimonas sp. (strain OK412) TaxID=1801619 RepID=UPI0008E4493B|nr:phytanoyl-CoA dioxygenase family protein [Collimonas sp. OK412]SFC27573.1 Phytanoyl-CoA dioxygenase (PhyH) [Collimonas sp. OK412]
MNQPYAAAKQPLSNPSVLYPDQEQLRDIRKTLPLRVLSAADFQHWQTYGYVIVKQAVSAEQVQRTVDFLWEFQELDRNAPDTWNRAQLRDHEMKELNGSGMVEAYHHQTFWDNRQTPRMVDAFVDIWDREDLWVTIDRANLNTPNQGARRFGGFIHWDADTSLEPLPVNVQGVLALSDTTPESGGFQCIPELFKHFAEWRKTAPKDRNPWRPDVESLPWQVRFVPMQAGDLLIFNSLLAHGIRPNTSADQVRLAQYIAFTPAREEEAELRNWRVASWTQRTPPDSYAFPGDPREWEKTRYPLAQLSELGEKILGKKPW